MDDPGILAAIPGEFLAEASHALPSPETATERRMSSTVDTGPLWKGMVRVTHERMLMKHRKHSHWAWIPVHAEKV